MEYSFTRYLAAKKTVDGRALNRLVWGTLARLLHGHQGTVGVVEPGAGIGTMLERLSGWSLLTEADYLGFDLQSENIATARQRLPAWAEANGYRVDIDEEDGYYLAKGRQEIRARFETADLLDFLTRPEGRQRYDLLVAHAFLDLLDLSGNLPDLLSLLRPGGLFYFTLNFDGMTLFEPILDPVFDEQVLALYHRTMNERRVNDRPAGDSRTGRHLFHHLQVAGAEILESGASDWVVFPRQGGYPADEAYFLHFILHFFDESLSGHAELDAGQFADWLAQRHAQIERGELVYLAHQLDFVGQMP